MDCLGMDCDDTDASVYPNAPEGINGNGDGKDNDCDGITDEGTSDFDDDGDGYTENEGDCDDSAPEVNPEATKIPDNDIDENCDKMRGELKRLRMASTMIAMVSSTRTILWMKLKTLRHLWMAKMKPSTMDAIVPAAFSAPQAVGILALVGLVGLRRKD